MLLVLCQVFSSILVPLRFFSYVNDLFSRVLKICNANANAN